MPQFTLSNGTEGLQQGLSGAFGAIARAGLARQQAENNAAYLGARINSANAAGAKNQAMADAENYTLDQRKGADGMMADPTLDDFRKSQLLAYKLAGPQHMDNFSKSGQTEQTIQSIRDIQNNPSLATATGQAYAATSGKMPFDNVGDTGRSINQLTGQGATMEPTLAKLFDLESGSKTAENRAQANNANAGAAHHNASTGKIKLETEALRDTDTAGPLSGKPLTNTQRRQNTNIDQARKFIKDTPPNMVRTVMNKSDFDLTAADKDLLARVKLARTAKFGEQDVPDELNNALGLDQNIIGQVIQQLSQPQTTQTMFGLGADRPMTEEETTAAIGKTLPQSERAGLPDYMSAARRKMGTTQPVKSAEGAPSGNTISKLPQGSKQIGTSKGKPVYQSPDGKKFIVE